MEHCAIDLGGRKSQVCIRASDGSIVHESREDTLELGNFLRGRPKSRVIVETCAEAFAIADAARNAGHEVRVVPATLVKTLGVGARRTKTDRRDAQVLSEVSCRIELPSVHVPTAWSREVKSICGMRDAPDTESALGRSHRARAAIPIEPTPRAPGSRSRTLVSRRPRVKNARQTSSSDRFRRRPCACAGRTPPPLDTQPRVAR